MKLMIARLTMVACWQPMDREWKPLNHASVYPKWGVIPHVLVAKMTMDHAVLGSYLDQLEKPTRALGSRRNQAPTKLHPSSWWETFLEGIPSSVPKISNPPPITVFFFVISQWICLCQFCIHLQCMLHGTCQSGLSLQEPQLAGDVSKASLVNIKLTGKWMFIHQNMVVIV